MSPAETEDGVALGTWDFDLNRLQGPSRDSGELPAVLSALPALLGGSERCTSEARGGMGVGGQAGQMVTLSRPPLTWPDTPSLALEPYQKPSESHSEGGRASAGRRGPRSVRSRARWVVGGSGCQQQSGAARFGSLGEAARCLGGKARRRLLSCRSRTVHRSWSDYNLTRGTGLEPTFAFRRLCRKGIVINRIEPVELHVNGYCYREIVGCHRKEKKKLNWIISDKEMRLQQESPRG